MTRELKLRLPFAFFSLSLFLPLSLQFDADVVGCILDSNDMVNAIDTYNPVSGRDNLQDTTSVSQ